MPSRGAWYLRPMHAGRVNLVLAARRGVAALVTAALTGCGAPAPPPNPPPVAHEEPRPAPAPPPSLSPTIGFADPSHTPFKVEPPRLEIVSEAPEVVARFTGTLELGTPA